MNNEKIVDATRHEHAIAGASAYIFNRRGELLLTRSVKWNNLWVPPGGKVEFGESLEEALKREMKEELGLNIKPIKQLTTIELNCPKEVPNLHLVVTEFIALAEDSEVKINDEHSSFEWRKPENWLKEKDLYPGVKEIIELYLRQEDENSFENKYKRALADYQNLLKQTAKEKEELAKFINEQLLLEILPIYDHLKLALEHATNVSDDTKNIIEGVGHVVRQFKDTLNKIGVEEIKTIGEKFDHNLMEAVDEEATTDKKFDHSVAKEIKAGYMLNGKVIIPAKVVVYKFK